MSATATREEQVQADQAAMEEARAQAAEEASVGQVGTVAEGDEVVEEPGGQLAAFGQPKFSNSAGGPPPSTGEVRLAGGKYDWEYDMERGHEFVALVRYKAGAPTIGDVKSWPCGLMDFAVFSTELSPSEAVIAVRDLQGRKQRDRALIDQCAQIAQELVDDGVMPGAGAAELMRERMYVRCDIDDDAYAVTHGTPDHEEPASEDEVDLIDGAEEATLTAEEADGEE